MKVSPQAAVPVPGRLKSTSVATAVRANLLNPDLETKTKRFVGR